MGWLIALAILTLIAILPVGVSAIYDEEGPRAFVLAGPIRITVFPNKKKKGKEKSNKNKTESKAKEKKSKTTVKNQQSDKKKGGSIHDFLPIVDLVLDFVAAFGRKLRINRLEMKLILGGSDPSDLAENYGKGWAVLGNLIPLLETAFVIKKSDLEVECDFLAESTTILARLDLTITIGRIISLLIVQGIPILREVIKLMKLLKGGAKA